MTPSRPILAAPAAALLALGPAPAALLAQSFDELTTFRNPPLPYSQVLQFRAGVLGAFAQSSDPSVGLEDEVAWDGSAWFHDESFGNRNGQLDAYAGRDGFVASILDGKVVGQDTATRLQLSGRLWSFYREGFYRGNAFVPVGRYEGTDWDAYLGFGREAAQGLFVEFGPFYRKYSFDRGPQTATNFVIPDDYSAYGARIHLEQNTVQLDRRSGLPRQGFLATAVLEREWNDSERAFGVTSGFLTELPSAVWRARGKLYWYFPQTETAVWELLTSAMLTDDQDRVVDYDAQHPQGNLWVDAQLRLRLPLGESLSVTPFVHGQFVRILQEDGVGSDKETFFGAGVETWLHFSESVSFTAWYSFLDNESRPTVSISEDLHGEHMFFAGFVLHFGGQRR
ncbi:MAG: hypothetical protein AB7O97_06515 [Planctomycetota bacterium]